MNNEQLMELFPCRVRRKISRGLKRKPMALIKKLRKKKKECPINEKPDVVKTHLRDMIIVPEMTGSVVGVYNGKTFNQVEIKVRICCSSYSIVKDSNAGLEVILRFLQNSPITKAVCTKMSKKNFAFSSIF